MMPRYRTIQDAVAQFQKAFQRPTNLDFSRIKQDKKVAEAFDLRQKLIYEECTELIQAMGQEKETQIKKEAADLLYVLAGLFVDFGWDMQVIFNRVHQSNMSKLDENGKPIFREDGKILKSNRYKEADLRGV
jgi:predicted HAD superfamily Cof-like phosphohydrolase|tara:strand:+ start:1313 stop:1708 length:396 start_codon:yes stop_codon:yes gene_type:complete